MKIMIKLHSVTGLIANSSTTVIMCVNSYTVNSITKFLDAILDAVMPGKKAEDLFDITLEWDGVYMERLIENILDEAYGDESLPEDERESAAIGDYEDYPAIKVYVEKKLEEYLPKEPEPGEHYFDSDMEMATKYLSIVAKDGVIIPDYLSANLYDIFTGEYISC